VPTSKTGRQGLSRLSHDSHACDGSVSTALSGWSWCPHDRQPCGERFVMSAANRVPIRQIACDFDIVDRRAQRRSRALLICRAAIDRAMEGPTEAGSASDADSRSGACSTSEMRTE
jgi:hypothetical protein